MQPLRPSLLLLGAGVLVVAPAGVASAQDAGDSGYPQVIVERPPILPLGTWRTSLSMSAIGATEEQTGSIGISTSLFPGIQTGLTLVTQLGRGEEESGPKVRARLDKSVLEGGRIAGIVSLYSVYDYDAREWGDIGIGALAQGRIGSLLFFMGGDELSGDVDQASVRLSLPVGVGLQLTPHLYIETVAMLDASYDSTDGRGGDVSPLSASAQASLNSSLDLVLTVNASEDHGADLSEALWLISARYQGTL